MSKARDYVFSRCFRGPHLITFSLVGVLSLVGCQDSSSRTTNTNNKDNSSLQKHSGDVEADQITYYDHSESFVAEALEVKSLGKPVHMLWAVDTTKTNRLPMDWYKKEWQGYNALDKNMADEIAAINKHLPLLIKSLKEVSAVQVAIISNFNGSSSHSINREVMESNGVLIRHDMSLGGFDFGISYLFESLKYLTNGSLEKHASWDFFRDPKALKVIVVARDRGVTANRSAESSNGSQLVVPPYSETFLADLKKFSGNKLSSFRFFALIDLRDSYLNNSCDKNEALGACNYSYTHLVEELGGEKYHTNNISSSEWSKVFGQLKSKLVEEIGGDGGEKTQKATFTLQRPASKILEVKVEGQALAKTSFQVTGNTLYIDAEHVSEGQNIVVKYQSTQST